MINFRWIIFYALLMGFSWSQEVVPLERQINFKYKVGASFNGGPIFRNTFNFYGEKSLISPYIDLGFVISPFGFQWGTGILYFYRAFFMQLGYVGSVPFVYENEVEDGLENYILLSLNQDIQRVSLINKTTFGNILQKIYLDVDKTEVKSIQYLSISNQFTIDFLLYSNFMHEILMISSVSFTHVFEYSGWLIQTAFSIPMYLWDIGWGQFVFKPRLTFGYNNKKDIQVLSQGYYTINSTKDVDNIFGSSEFIDPLPATLMLTYDITYRLFPFYGLGSEKAVFKRIYMAFSMVGSWFFNDDYRVEKSRFNYSLLYSLGYKIDLKGTEVVSIGVGYSPLNNKPKFVINFAGGL